VLSGVPVSEVGAVFALGKALTAWGQWVICAGVLGPPVLDTDTGNHYKIPSASS